LIEPRDHLRRVDVVLLRGDVEEREDPERVKAGDLERECLRVLDLGEVVEERLDRERPCLVDRFLVRSSSSPGRRRETLRPG
jgi:hypothetical protein